MGCRGICGALLGFLALAASVGAEPFELANQYIELKGDAARVESLRFDPAGTGSFSANILREGGAGLSWEADGKPFQPAEIRIRERPERGQLELIAHDNDKERLIFKLDGRSLTTEFRGPAEAGVAGVRLDLPFRREGYFDRQTGKLLRPDATPVQPWPFRRFINLKTGNLASIESLQRRVSVYPERRNWLEHDGGTAYLAQGLHGFDLKLDFQHPMTFVTGDERLELVAVGGVARSFRLNIDVLPTTPSIQLADSRVTPWLEVESDTTLTNDAGGAYPLSQALDDLFQETLAWYGTPAANGAWGDWLTKGFVFADGPVAARIGRQLLSWPVGDDGLGRDGYAYTWQGLRGWPFPAKMDTRHTVTNAIFITAVWRHFAWSGDRAFLTQSAGRVRRAMEYQLEYLHARELGIVLSDEKFGPNMGGRNQKDLGTNFYDIQPFGGRDAYATIQYYRSLGAMAELEQALGDAEAARRYREELMPASFKAFNETFWNDEAGRYIACIDLDGNRIDFGHTFLQLEAIEAGLVPQERAGRIFAWLDDPAQDTYSRWEFAARHNTLDNRTWWAPLGIEFWPWDDQVQNGGALLHESAFDLIARSRTQPVEGFSGRYMAILRRYVQPDRLTGGNPLWRGEKQQGGDFGPGSIGVMTNEFPETALLAEALFSSVLGLTAGVEGLRIAPVLPAEFKAFAIHDLHYQGSLFTIRATREAVEVECTRLRAGLALNVGGERYTAPFRAEIPWKAGEAIVIAAE